MNPVARDVRSAQRRDLSYTCLCRLAGGAIASAQLHDITPRGAKVKISGLNPQFGERVEILFTEHEGIQGTVRRVDGEFAGLEFEIALPEHFVERLVFDNPPDHG